MRYRALDADGDMTFGQGRANFLVNSPEAVAQALRTRLLLLSGEWFLDTTEGTPYATEILGKTTRATYDRAIRDRILDTQGVLAIAEYSSTVSDRRLQVSATIDTAYGVVAMRLRGFAPTSSGTVAAAIIDFSYPENSGLLPAL